MTRGRVLVVEDDASLRELLAEELEQKGQEVVVAADLASADAHLAADGCDLIVTDLRLPDGAGTRLVETAAAHSRQPAVLIVTAFGGVDDAVEALKLGADDFLTKPLDFEHFHIAVGRLLEARRMRRELLRLRAERTAHGGLVGQSTAMRRLRERIAIIAPQDGPALLLGESGTGKELVARALHAQSPRSEGPFVAVNCAGVPGELLESEFFGHVAGAFTGASRSRAGLFQQAEGGTLLLDELGEMPVPLQAKLLRVLEDGRVRAVGGTEERTVDVRVIAATNRDVDAQRRDGSLREDLFFRLETFTLELPALREREDDVELLARHFLEEFRASRDDGPSGLDRAALQALRRHPFPGNVRELRNAIERAVAFASGPRITRQDLPERIARHGTRSDDPMEDVDASEYLSVGDRPSVEQLQRRYAAWMLAQERGNKLRTAERLGITRSTLYRWREPPVARQGENE